MFATADEKGASLFGALATAAVRRTDAQRHCRRHIGRFNLRELAITSWAFANVATAGQKDASLFAALATAARRCMEHFSEEELVNTAWAFAFVDQKDALLFATLAAAAPVSYTHLTLPTILLV